jgi:uncharacterized protein (DUF3084 family)
LGLFVVTGGAIGVLADNLGRKIGKKKLSFRSMRPKHVARLGTFIAGSLVALITILLVYSTSSGIREWITKGRAAIGRAKELTAQNGTLEAEIGAKTAHIDQLDREAKLARASLNDATAKLATIKSDLSTANSRLAEAKQRVTAGQLALARNQAMLRQNQALLRTRQAELAKVASRLKDAGARYAALKGNYKSVDKERIEANDEVVKVTNRLTTLNKEIRSLGDESAELKKETERETTNLRNARDELHDRSLALATVNSELETARAELQRAVQTRDTILQVALAIRSLPMTYSNGQEVFRKHLGPHLSVRQAHDALAVLKRDASEAARARGAGALADTEAYAFVREQLRADGTIIEPSELEDAIVAGLTSSDRDVVLVARAAVNTFKGESVPLEIVGYPNPVVYHKGDVLDTLSVRPKSKQLTVLTQFTDFMNQRVRTRAIKDGMIPAVGQEGSLLDVAPSEIFALVERLANSDRPQQLQIVARAETRAADALQLDFFIK